MLRLAAMAAAVLVGLAIAAVVPFDTAQLPDSQTYLLGTALLLAIGLYGSTYGIDHRSARRDSKLILSAITVGVIVKAALIGGVLALSFWDPLFLILGVVMAQIDPLSVAALMGHQRLSVRARTILASWSSFDDPITVILVVYAVVLLPGGGELGGADLRAFVANLGFAALVYLLWRLLRRHPVATTALLVATIAVGVWQLWMLAVAIIGLFLRPDWLRRVLPGVIETALFGASVVLGMLLIDGVAWGHGIALGAAAFAAQVVVGWLLTRRLPWHDRIHLALAQQNGITAIILALLLESVQHGIAAIVAPAILTVNVIHYLANRLADRHAAKNGTASADQHL